MTSATPPSSRSERRDATRTALLDATLALLLEDGFEAATTRAIASRAGMTHGAVQHHFGTRQQLVGAAVERWGRQMVAQAFSQPLGDGDERELAARLLGMLWDFHAEPPGPVVFELLHAARHEPAVAAQVRRGMGSLWELVLAAARDLTPSYARRVGYEDHLRLVIGSMRGLVMMQAPGVESALLGRERFIELALASFEALPEPEPS